MRETVVLEYVWDFPEEKNMENNYFIPINTYFQKVSPVDALQKDTKRLYRLLTRILFTAKSLSDTNPIQLYKIYNSTKNKKDQQ